MVWPFVDMKGKKVVLKDLMHGARYEWEGDALLYRGLYVDLPSWGFHVFAWQGGYLGQLQDIQPEPRQT